MNHLFFPYLTHFIQAILHRLIHHGFINTVLCFEKASWFCVTNIPGLPETSLEKILLSLRQIIFKLLLNGEKKMNFLDLALLLVLLVYPLASLHLSKLLLNYSVVYTQ